MNLACSSTWMLIAVFIVTSFLVRVTNTTDADSPDLSPPQPKLIGLRIENPEDMAPNKDEMVPRVRPEVNIIVTLFGIRMDLVAQVLFSPRPDCDQMPWMKIMEKFDQQLPDVLTVRLKFPVPDVDELYYVCLLSKYEHLRQTGGHGVDPSNETFLNLTLENTTVFLHETAVTEADLANDSGDDLDPVDRPIYGQNLIHSGFVFQGSENHQIFVVTELEDDIEMPLWLQVSIISAMLLLSGLFSGLNLGLMSLDQTELQIFMNSGTRKEKRYAKSIYPLRRLGNYLLCSILFANVIVNSAISILFDDLFPGLGALCLSSLGIVIFGEILPQSLCSRYGLAIGAKTIWITKFFMFVTAPLSWPTSKILDKLLGKEVGHYYNRERLLELIRLTTDLQHELKSCQEVAIVTGALELGSKTVKDCMTPLKDVFMLPHDAVLDTKTVSAISRSGYTRIPVYERTRDNVTMLLNIKDMALLNPQDRIPLKTVCKFYQHQVRRVPENTPLNVMLNEFKVGHYHVAFIEKNPKPSDPEGTHKELVGLLTLEDVIEEIFQSDIMDESDVAVEKVLFNYKQADNEPGARDFSMFTDDDLDINGVSPQLAIAAYQYLTTSLEPFSSKHLSEQVLQFLIKKGIFVMKIPEASEKSKYLFTKDTPADYFILILEGRVEVTSGNESLTFDAGPFYSFGRPLLQNIASHPSSDDPKILQFTPDYTVRVLKDLMYFQLKASSYLSALRASVIEKQTGNPLVISSMLENSHKIFMPDKPRKKKTSASLGLGGMSFDHQGKQSQTEVIPNGTLSLSPNSSFSRRLSMSGEQDPEKKELLSQPFDQNTGSAKITFS